MRLKLLDPPFIGGHDGIGVGIDDPVQKLLDLALDQPDILLQRRSLRVGAGDLRIPQIAEHFEGEIEQPFRWLETLQQRLEVAFDDFLAHRFPMGHASACITEIIWVSCATPLRPTGGQRFEAMTAGDEAAQGEVLMQVLPRRNPGDTIAPVLRGLPCGKAHQRLMLGRNQVKAPIFNRDVACINRTGEDFGDALDMNLVVAVARIGRLGFQKALHFRHRLEATRGKALKRFRDDRGQRLVAHQKLAVSGHALIFITNGSMKDPIAVLRAGAHTVFGLLGVLLALML